MHSRYRTVASKWLVLASFAAGSGCGGSGPGTTSSPSTPVSERSSLAPSAGSAVVPEAVPQTPVASDSASPPVGTASSHSDSRSAPQEATSTNQESERKSESIPGTGSPSETVAIRGTRVLHIGDSFAGALGIKLSELMKAEGVTPILEASDSSYIVDWAHRKSLDRLVWKYNPDLVIVTLGANELAMTEPNQRARAIKKIVEQIGPRPCVWVAIPYWDTKHNALMDVIRENSAPCYFHDTNALMEVEKMARIRDGIHPTEEARAAWAKFFFEWLKAERRPEIGRPWALAESSKAPAGAASK